MADIQRLIDELRCRVQSADWELTDELRANAGEYAQLCRATNERLRRCGEFLRQGLRSEAVHLADSQPRLLDMLAIIDFPERGDWDEMVAMYQLPKADALLLDVAEQLNEAYALQHPLERWLDRHRLFALQRAPLSQRLTVLRKIAELDPSNPVWDEDVRTFEKARLAEIEVLAQSAAACGDEAVLATCDAELAQAGWRESPSKALRQRVKRSAEDASRRAARIELDTVERDLNAAFGQLDLGGAQALRHRWTDLAARARLATDDPLVERVAPAMGWLADEDTRAATDNAYAAAVAALERVLDQDSANADAIRRAGHAVLKCDRGLPQLLDVRYRERLHSVDLMAQRRHRMTLGFAAASVLAAVAVVAMIVQRSHTSAVLSSVTSSAKQLIEDGKLKEAHDLLSLHSDLSDWPDWLETQKRLVDAESEEERRSARYQELLESAEGAAESEPAQVALKEAKRLARSPEEKHAVVRLEEHWRKVDSTAHAARDALFQERVSSLAENVRKLEQMHATQSHGEEFVKLAAAATQTVSELKPQSKFVPGGLGSQFNLLDSRTQAIGRVTAALRRKAAMFDEFTKLTLFHPGVPDAEPKLQQYAELSAEFAKEYGADPRAAAFAEAATDAGALRGVVAWQRLSDSWKESLPGNFETAKQRSNECRQWLDRFERSPDAPLLREYLDYSRSIVARDGDSMGDGEESVRRALLQLFSEPLIDGVQCVETNAGVLYYLPAEQTLSNASTVRFEYIAGFSGEKKKKTLQSSDLKYDRTRPAPQSEIAKRVRGKLPSVSLKEWDAFLSELATDVLGDKHLDSVLKHFLLVKVLEQAGNGNSLLKRELKPTLARLEDDKIDPTAKWMDPDDSAAKVARQQATRALGLLGKGEVTEAWRRAAENEAGLARRVRRHVMAVGWLAKDDAGNWTVKTGWSPSEKHSLLIAMPAEPSLAWTSIGTADPQGGIRLDGSAGGAYRWGRMVFASDSEK